MNSNPSTGNLSEKYYISDTNFIGGTSVFIASGNVEYTMENYNISATSLHAIQANANSVINLIGCNFSGNTSTYITATYPVSSKSGSPMMRDGVSWDGCDSNN